MLGVAAILYPGFPRLKEWAYAGFTFDMLSAMYSGYIVARPPHVAANGSLKRSPNSRCSPPRGGRLTGEPYFHYPRSLHTLDLAYWHGDSREFEYRKRAASRWHDGTRVSSPICP